jgi:hypothetical protein
MGIFDKIKDVFSGTGASVRVRAVNQINDVKSPIKIIVECTTTNKDIDIDQVYVNIRAIEEVRYYKNKHTNRRQPGSYGGTNTNAVTTFKQDVQATGPLHIPAHGVYEWEVEINLPSNVNGTYRGSNASHEWSIRAGLDVKGIDPKSNWVVIDVNNPY